VLHSCYGLLGGPLLWFDRVLPGSQFCREPTEMVDEQGWQ